MATSTAATTTTGSPPCECSSSSRVNLDVPRWSQASYEGRARHFFTTTNPLNLLASPAKLDWAKDVVDKHRYTALLHAVFIELAWLFLEPDTGLEDCLRVLQAWSSE